MARPREFDEGAVLERARDAFWRGGWASTSVDDLTRATGLGKASLYAAFGDKRSLYLRALDAYQREGRELFLETVRGAGGGLDGLRALLALIARECTGPDADVGCFFVNAMVEVASRDRLVGERTRAHARFLEDLLARAVTTARREGRLPRSLDARPAARFLVGTIVGMHALSRAFPGARRHAETAELALRALQAFGEPSKRRPGRRRSEPDRDRAKPLRRLPAPGRGRAPRRPAP